MNGEPNQLFRVVGRNHHRFVEIETGQALDLSETAVKTRLLRARLRLREDLSKYYGERLDKRSKK